MSATQLGVDVGGTFTDVVLERPNDAPVVHKVSTTPDQPLVGVFRGIAEACRRADISVGNLDRIVHGTTLVSNTILERRGAEVVLLTTRGFRDLPTLGRSSVVESARYDLFARPQVPPLPLAEVIEVDERIDGRGRVRQGPGAEELRRVEAAVAASPAQAVAVTFMNAYLRGDHEQLVAEALRKATDRPVFVSSELSPLPGEYDRLVTTVLSASLSAVVGDYLMRLGDMLESEGFAGRLEVMDASGGCISTTEAARAPVRLIESGGAAAVTGAAVAAEETRSGDAVAFDMGGTTAKAAVVRDRRPQLTNRFQLGGTGSFGTSRVGTGLPITVPVVDLAEMSAGGGSVAWIDDGRLRLGPRSAGARPGPVCYGRDGTAVTVTDAAVHLGYIDPDSFADGIKLELGAAAAALASLGKPLGYDADRAAWAVHQLAVEQLVAAVRVVTLQRGIDPRGLTLIAFGGAGPLHAARLAERLGMRRVLVPLGAGAIAATGMVRGDAVAHRSQSLSIPSPMDDPLVREVIDSLVSAADTGRERTERGRQDPPAKVELVLEIRAKGQMHPIDVEVDGRATAGEIDAAFRAAYLARYHVELPADAGGGVIAVRARLMWSPPAVATTPALRASGPSGRTRTRAIAVGPGERTEAEVRAWDTLGLDTPLEGPAIVTAPDTTVLIPPGWRGRADEHGHLLLSRTDVASPGAPGEGS